MNRYEVRMSRDYVMQVEAETEDEALEIAEETPAEEWDEASWSSVDVDLLAQHIEEEDE